MSAKISHKIKCTPCHNVALNVLLSLGCYLQDSSGTVCVGSLGSPDAVTFPAAPMVRVKQSKKCSSAWPHRLSLLPCHPDTAGSAGVIPET